MKFKSFQGPLEYPLKIWGFQEQCEAPGPFGSSSGVEDCSLNFRAPSIHPTTHLLFSAQWLPCRVHQMFRSYSFG